MNQITACLWSDAVVEKITCEPPKFPLAERKYFLDAVRYVDSVIVIDKLADGNSLPDDTDATKWIVAEKDASSEKASFCEDSGIEYAVIPESQLDGFPLPSETELAATGKKKVIVTGCYDWFHTGHIRFFEEVSELGDLYVGLGSDDTIEFLKGKGHPMFKENERRYVVQSIKFVKQALINSGSGWLDAEPEMKRIKPDIYAVNEDGDKPEKSEYCEANGIEYVVLKRTPAPGLPRRESTSLRGF